MDLGRLGEDTVEVEKARLHPLGQAQSTLGVHGLTGSSHEFV
jgi:hypothetical protein